LLKVDNSHNQRHFYFKPNINQALKGGLTAIVLQKGDVVSAYGTGGGTVCGPVHVRALFVASAF
jgi:hypothetical protein